MTRKKSKYQAIIASMIPALALCGCSENEEPNGPENESDVQGKFVFATTIESSNGTAYDLITGESLDDGNLTTVDNGLLNPGATQWVFHNNYLYALTYNQGNAGTTRSYILGSNGEVEARDIEYSISRFSSYGTYNNDIITMSTGEGPCVIN